MVAFNLTMRLLFGLGFFQRSHLLFGQQNTLLSSAGFQGLQALLHCFQIQIARTPEEDTIMPFCCSSQLAHLWPRAGFSIANSITARSTGSGTWFLRMGFLRLHAVLLRQPCKRHLFVDRLKRTLGFEIR